MKTETRNYTITSSDFEDFVSIPQYYHLPLVLRYNGKLCALSCGTSDSISVFRYDKEHFAVLSTNFGLDYASLTIISIDDMEDIMVNDGTNAIVNEVFIDNVTEQLNPDLRKDFFDYTENTQADILAQWLQ